jgi:hypothetical protein
MQQHHGHQHDAEYAAEVGHEESDVGQDARRSPRGLAGQKHMRPESVKHKVRHRGQSQDGGQVGAGNGFRHGRRASIGLS